MSKDGWIAVAPETMPPRNTNVLYWNKGFDGHIGFPAIADEWRDEDHARFATHWKLITPPGAKP